MDNVSIREIFNELGKNSGLKHYPLSIIHYLMSGNKIFFIFRFPSVFTLTFAIVKLHY